MKERLEEQRSCLFKVLVCSFIIKVIIQLVESVPLPFRLSSVCQPILLAVIL